MKINNWNGVPIALYNELMDILRMDYPTEWEREINIIALLEGIDVDEIYDWEITKVKKYREELVWLNEFNFDKHFNSKKITIANKTYNLNVDSNTMTTAQYIDFQIYWGKEDRGKYLPEILACFIVPENSKYNDGSYDLEELINLIRNTISIALANSICFFFLKKWMTSLAATACYGVIRMKKTMRKEKNKEKKEEMKKKLEEMTKQAQILVGYHSLIQ